MAARLPTANGWSIVQQELAAAGDGEFVVDVDYLTVDPAVRVWMNAGDYLHARKKIDEVMRSMAIGTVVESRHDLFPRQTEHHPDTPNTTDPAGQPLAGSFHARTSSPSTPPPCSS